MKTACLITTLLTCSSYVSAFSDEKIAKIRAGMLEVATHSWEIGTATEALFELEWFPVSVFSKTAFPLPEELTPDFSVQDVLDIAKTTIDNKNWSQPILIDGDGAAGDPASLGIAVLFANWTLPDKNDTRYGLAASQQLEHLLTAVPRSPSGAISHRESEVQLWADFVAMVPPFLAYYGAIQNNRTLLQEAYDQCRLYREFFVDESGLWKHIQFTNWGDLTHWGTGNAWAVEGMLRVHQTLMHSELANEFASQRADLEDWITEVVSSAWKYQQTNGTLLNTLDNSTSFADSASTAMMAAATYRIASITLDYSQLFYAERAYKLIEESVDEDGWVLNAVDPLTFDTPLKPGSHSPEAQAFTIMMIAARRDFYSHKGGSWGRRSTHSRRRLDHHH